MTKLVKYVKKYYNYLLNNYNKHKVKYISVFSFALGFLLRYKNSSLLIITIPIACETNRIIPYLSFQQNYGIIGIIMFNSGYLVRGIINTFLNF